jgi:hypothetical protein
MWLPLCGVLSLVILGCLGLYLDGLSSCLLVGGPLEGRCVLQVWKMVPTCLFWCLWSKKNSRSFEDLEGSLEDILSSFFAYVVSLGCSLCVPFFQLVLMISLFVLDYLGNSF